MHHIFFLLHQGSRMEPSHMTSLSLLLLAFYATCFSVLGQSSCPANTCTCNCDDNTDEIQDLQERVICLENAMDEHITASNQVVKGGLQSL